MKFLHKFWIIVIGERCFPIRREKLALLLILYQLTEVNATFPRLESDLKLILYIANKIQLNPYFIFSDLNTKKKKSQTHEIMKEKMVGSDLTPEEPAPSQELRQEWSH